MNIGSVPRTAMPMQPVRNVGVRNVQPQAFQATRGTLPVYHKAEVAQLMRHAQSMKGAGGMPPELAFMLPPGGMEQKAKGAKSGFMKSMACKIAAKGAMTVLKIASQAIV